MKNLKLITALLAAFVLTACATRLTKPEGPALPPKVPFAAFDKVVIYPMTISPKFAEDGSNISARDKMDRYLKELLAATFVNKEFVIAEEGQQVPSDGKRTLVINPRIKEIKFISTGARIFAGAMAGGSAVLMDAKFTDQSNNAVIGQPEFYADASAWSGWGADNKVLNRVVEDINHYVRINH